MGTSPHFPAAGEVREMAVPISAPPQEETSEEEEEGGPAAADGQGVDKERLTEEDYEMIRADILQKRAEFQSPHDETLFRVRQRGGVSNVEAGRDAVNCAAVFANAGPAVRFCEIYGFKGQRSYHYRKYGGMGPSNSLAREWCRVGNYYCAVWVEHDCDESYTFTPSDILGLGHDASFLDAFVLSLVRRPTRIHAGACGEASGASTRSGGTERNRIQNEAGAEQPGLLRGP